jgi:hypothetical protein
VLQAGFVLIEVPRRGGHELGDVRVDLVAILVELRGRETILLRWVAKVWGGFVGSARVRGRGGRGGRDP